MNYDSFSSTHQLHRLVDGRVLVNLRGKGPKAMVCGFLSEWSSIFGANILCRAAWRGERSRWVVRNFHRHKIYGRNWLDAKTMRCGATSRPRRRITKYYVVIFCLL